ncbi:hypothetical protein C8Q75DRAFT_138645 [Abortiporus biennis]|nr:hypothetical protein C8Q75DRAFT_138645 [Abortiporus biennis]
MFAAIDRLGALTVCITSLLFFFSSSSGILQLPSDHRGFLSSLVDNMFIFRGIDFHKGHHPRFKPLFDFRGLRMELCPFSCGCGSRYSGIPCCGHTFVLFKGRVCFLVYATRWYIVPSIKYTICAIHRMSFEFGP